MKIATPIMTLIVGLLCGLAINANPGHAKKGETPATPFNFGVKEEGEWFMLREYLHEQIEITILGPHQIRRHGRSRTVIRAAWDEDQGHLDTRIFAEIAPMP